MMIRLLSDRVSGGNYYWSGEVYDWPDDDARRLIRAGQAEQVREPECAMVATGSKAVLDKPRPRFTGSTKHGSR